MNDMVVPVRGEPLGVEECPSDATEQYINEVALIGASEMARGYGVDVPTGPFHVQWHGSALEACMGEWVFGVNLEGLDPDSDVARSEIFAALFKAMIKPSYREPPCARCAAMHAR